ncbi:hypothetical protein VNO80_02092 [Phaseolus coccineus]|uniref:Uncharacterized protein n=1 Tax=Phaseolus coccineus TaxID=3886 RepID=A0AAN9NTM1_PHACN
MFSPNTVLIGTMRILDFELLLELDNHSFGCGVDCAYSNRYLKQFLLSYGIDLLPPFLLLFGFWFARESIFSCGISSSSIMRNVSLPDWIREGPVVEALKKKSIVVEYQFNHAAAELA